MSLSIKYKLFFAILSAHVIVYVAMYSIGRYNFERGFLEYISRIDETQVPALISGLSDFHEHTGSWDILRANPGKWGSLIRESIESSNTSSPISPQATRHTPTGISKNDWYYSSEYSPARPYLLLLNKNKAIIFGNPEALPLATLNPIIDRGETVGYLAVTSRQELSEQADVLFSEQQKQSFFMFAIVLVLISASIAFPLSTFLVRPIRDVVGGTRALTTGDYSSRLPIRGSDELSQLSQDFNTLAKTLDKNRTARRQWIADISHELRTPLAILRGELEAVQDGIRPLNPETLESLHHEVIHLNVLVNDLHELSMSDLGALVYEKEQININLVLEQTIDSYQQLTKQHEITVNTEFKSLYVDDAILLFGDVSRLTQLFGNLMQNTCRYTDAGGQLNIKIKEAPHTVLIEWTDSSPGVSEQDLQHLFDRLYRAESSRNRQLGGSGLGLAICKNIIEAHEGSIQAEHSKIGGLKLTIKLPKKSSQLS